MATKNLQLVLDLKDEFSRNFNKLHKSFRLTSTGLGQLSSGIKSLAAGFIGFQTVSKATEVMVSFEKEMTNVATIVDTTRVSIEEFSNSIIELSPEVGKNANDLAQGLYQVVSAGIATADAMEVLEAAAKAGTAGLTATETAVDIITTGLNAYGKSADEAAAISDILFTAVRLGKTTFEELAKFLGPVLPIANQLGISLEEVAAATSTLTASGIKTNIAVTSLRAAFVGLIQNAEKFREIGIDVNKVISEEGFQGVLQRVMKVTKGNTEEMQKLFPSVESLASVLTLAGQGADKFNADLAEMRGSLGATEDAFKKQSETAQFSIDQMKIVFEELALVSGKTFLPALKVVVRVLTSVVKGFLAFAENIGKGLEFILAVGDDFIRLFWDTMVGGMKLIGDGLLRAFIGMLESLTVLASKGIKRLWSALKGETTQGSFWQDLRNSFAEGFNTAFEGYDDAAMRLTERIDGHLESINEQFSIRFLDDATQESMIEKAQATGQAVGDAIAAGAEKGGEKILEVGSELEGRLIEWAVSIPSVASQMAGVITSTFDMIATGVGDAVADTIMEGKNLGEGLKELMKNVAKNIISQLVRIAVQRLILAALGRALGAQDFMAAMAQGSAKVWMNSFASAAAIPVIGWAIAAQVATANTAVAVSGIAGTFGAGMAAGSGLAGAAHGGLSNVPNEQTYLLNAGERVLSPNQNADMTEFLDSERRRAEDLAGGGGGGEGQIIVQVLPNATNIEALLSMSKEDIDELMEEQLVPSMKRLNIGLARD